ncbi:MAG TPA: NUDIX hydrolase [Pseudomonadales bacterium]
MRLALTIFAMAFTLACSNKAPAPECLIDAAYKSDKQANAGCFIHDNGKLLVIRQRINSKLSTPGGTNKTGETAQCTAHRETWEEAGVNVVVGRELHVFSNEFYLYECSITNTKTPLHSNDLIEVSEVLWVDPRDTLKTNWRYSDQYALIIELLDAQ